MCHPGLRANWFANLGTDEHNQAKVLFSAVYGSYAETEPSRPAAPAPAPSAAEVDFLEMVGAAPAVYVPQETPALSECERWFAMEGGRGQLKQPLVWWKVHCSSSMPYLVLMS